MRSRINKKNIFRIVGLFLLFAVTTAVTYGFLLYKRVYQPANKVYTFENDNFTPTPTPDPLAPKNVLLLGYGGVGHDGGSLTDTIIIAHIVPRENLVILISIPRDLWVPIPVTKDKKEFWKINHAYAIGIDDKNYPDKDEKYDGVAGGGLMAKEVIGEAVGLNIDHYVSVDFRGFTNIVDILGGVTVDVPFTFEDKFYPIKGLENETCGKTEEDVEAVTATLSGELLEREFLCRYETLRFARGKQLLDSVSALKFVRSRHSDTNGNDFGRSLRQQAFIIGIKNKLLSFSGFTKTIQIANELSKNLTTDINIADAFGLLEDTGLQDVTIKTISINTDNVLMESISSNRQYILTTKEGEGNFTELKKYIKLNLEELKEKDAATN